MQPIRIQAKSTQAEATRWSKHDPFNNPYIESNVSVSGNGFAVKDLHPESIKIDLAYTQPGQPQAVVKDGYYIVKRRESEYVEVYSPEEFARRYNVVQPDAAH